MLCDVASFCPGAVAVVVWRVMGPSQDSLLRQDTEEEVPPSLTFLGPGPGGWRDGTLGAAGLGRGVLEGVWECGGQEQAPTYPVVLGS